MSIHPLCLLGHHRERTVRYARLPHDWQQKAAIELRPDAVAREELGWELRICLRCGHRDRPRRLDSALTTGEHWELFGEIPRKER